MIDLSSYKQAAKQQLEPNIYNHSLSLAACMAGLYDYLAENKQLSDTEPSKDLWELAALVHDIDYCPGYKETHPSNTLEVLAKYNLELDPVVHNIVRAHAPELTGYKPQSKAEWAIFCADSLTGLITAVAFVYPSRKLAEVKTSSVLKRFLKEPKFAAGTRRDEVKQCELPEGLGIPLEKFIEVCLASMQKIATKIGL